MRLRLTIDVEIDPRAWAEEFGHDAPSGIDAKRAEGLAAGELLTDNAAYALKPHRYLLLGDPQVQPPQITTLGTVLRT